MVKTPEPTPLMIEVSPFNFVNSLFLNWGKEAEVKVEIGHPNQLELHRIAEQIRRYNEQYGEEE